MLAREQMKMIEVELAKVRSDIEKLRAKEEVLVELLGKMSGKPTAVPPPARTRSPSVKPLVLDIVRDAGSVGVTTKEVDDLVRNQVPTVAKETVGSVLSRLKADGVLTYWGERYYEKHLAPKEAHGPFERIARPVVN